VASSPRFKPSYPSNPESVIQAARQRARAALKETNPKLTSLEKAFYEKFKADEIIGIKVLKKGRYIVSTRASQKLERTSRADARRPAA
jgi:hypothetical protein|tara:strand:- start:4707 stop:4970 length:264 start_codon:yes stop_codon:yes gene_type:complete